MMEKRNFHEKTVLVTGGASGIGRATARCFAAAGAFTAVLDLDEEDLLFTKEEFEEKGLPVEAIRCDITDARQVLRAADRIIDRFGRIDVLVNNAGITLRDALCNLEPEGFEKIIRTNLFGSFLCTRACLPQIVKNKGLIIVISSIAGFSPLPGRSAYCASKYALHGLFETARLELKPLGVDVMIVCPTFVRTDLQKRAIAGDGTPAGHPQSVKGKVLSPEEAAERIYRGACKRKKLLVLGSTGILAWWLSRFTPGFYGSMVAKKFYTEIERATMMPGGPAGIRQS